MFILNEGSRHDVKIEFFPRCVYRFKQMKIYIEEGASGFFPRVV